MGPDNSVIFPLLLCVVFLLAVAAGNKLLIVASGVMFVFTYLRDN